MLVSIVIVSLNGEKRLRGCLRSVFASRWAELEVIVVDNGSTDGTSEVVREGFPEAMLLRTERNRGFAGGNNVGLKRARGEWIILLNDDTEVEPGWIEALMEAARAYPKAGILGCKLLYPDRKTIQHCGGIVQANALTNHIGYGEEDRGQYDRIAEVSYVTGAAIAIRRDVIERIGYLDAGYFPIYFEEIDYCWRARRAGYACLFVPGAVVYHHESLTTKRLSSGFHYKYNKNRIRFVLKNYDRGELMNALRAEVKWLVRHRPYDLLLPLARAYGANLLGLGERLRARRESRAGGRGARNS
jgi:GT2 family glycosyltransferase